MVCEAFGRLIPHVDSIDHVSACLDRRGDLDRLPRGAQGFSRGARK